MADLPFAPDHILSAAQLRAAGIDSHAVARLARDGALHHLATGWYSTRQPTDALDRHLLLCRAVLRRLHGRAALSHTSRVAAAQLPLWHADLGRAHVTRLADEVTRRRPHVVSHARIRGLKVESVTGLGAVVPLGVGIVQTGLVAGAMSAAIAADAALNRGLLAPKAIDEAVALLGGHRGLPATAAALRRCDARRESPAETRLAHLLADLGLRVTPQFRVDTALGVRRADFRIDGTRVLLEVDGRVKYVDPKREGDTLWQEKRRQEAIEDEGWTVVRITWAELDDPARLWARIGAAMNRSARAA